MINARTLAAVALLFSAAHAASAQPYKLDVGPFKVAQIEEDWVDAQRERTIPVRLYLPAGTNGPQPIILLSHGLGGSRVAMAYLGQHWASHGYVVVALQHPGSDESVWKNAAAGQRLAVMREAANFSNAVARCGDVHFAIDQLTDLAKPGSTLDGKLDLAHIGIAGHSFGAQTVQGVLGQLPPPTVRLAQPLAEPRITAGIAFSPAYHGAALRGGAKGAFSAITAPCFHVTGTRDNSAIVGDVEAAERRVPYDAIDADDQFLMTFTDADHAVFGGSRPGNESPLNARIHDGVRQASTAFWDAELRSDAAARAWLTGDGAKSVLSPLGTFERKDATELPAASPAAPASRPTTRPARQR